MSDEEIDAEFERRMRRAFDAAAMDDAEDATTYALLDLASLAEEERKRLLPVVLPILAALVHVAEHGADVAGLTRAQFVAEVRRLRDHRHGDDAR